MYKKKTMDFLSIELGCERTSVCSGGSDRALILLRSVSDFILLVFLTFEDSTPANVNRCRSARATEGRYSQSSPVQAR